MSASRKAVVSIYLEGPAGREITVPDNWDSMSMNEQRKFIGPVVAHLIKDSVAVQIKR